MKKLIFVIALFMPIPISSAFSQVSNSYTITTTSPNQSCFTFTSGSLTSVVSGACQASTTCTTNIKFDFSNGCDLIALEEEIP
jgi:hypothetical protein